jgi:hypothetical protein
MTREKEPWWYFRCTHNTHPVGCYEVEREAEQVVILRVLCLPQYHILVSDHAGSSCKVVTREQFQGLDEMQLMRLLQDQLKFLRTLR